MEHQIYDNSHDDLYDANPYDSVILTVSMRGVRQLKNYQSYFQNYAHRDKSKVTHAR